MRAVLFDLDGTLVDNMAYHARAWMELCARYGIAGNVEQFEREFAGKKNGEILTTLLGPDLDPERARALADEKEAAYRDVYAKHVAWIAGAESFIHRLRAAGVPRAIGSAAPPLNRTMVLEALGATALFDAIIGGEQVVHGKPAPDIFIAAAAAVGVAPEDCVVFEDAVNGVRAGKACGAYTVGICSSESASVLTDAGADVAVADFTSLPNVVLAKLGLLAA